MGKYLDMGRKITETEERRMDCNAADLANATTFLRPSPIPITGKNHLDICVDTSFSAYAAVAYLNGELYMGRPDLPLYHQSLYPNSS